MISLKSKDEIKRMRDAALIAIDAIDLMIKAVEPGITTMELDDIAYRYIISKGAKPGFKGYGGFPGTACISINEEIVHGIPGPRKLREGDIVTFDTGAYLHGYHSDMARTVGVGKISEEAARLIRLTEESFFNGIKYAVAGNRIHDISAGVEKVALDNGLGIVREYTGHGLGTDLHEEPEVPNYTSRIKGPVLRPGLVICVEPMLTLGAEDTILAENEWTASTSDGSLASHYENTIVITDNGPCEIITLK